MQKDIKDSVNWYSDSLLNYYKNYFSQEDLKIKRKKVMIQGHCYLLYGLFPSSEGSFYNVALEAVRTDELVGAKPLKQKVSIRFSGEDFNKISTSLKSDEVEVSEEVYEYIDLTSELSEIKKRLRKSYKSLVNKLDGIRVVDSTDEIYKAIFDCKELHFSVSGKRTRSEDTWTSMADAVVNQEGLLVVKYSANNLLGYCFFFHNEINSYYSSSVMKDRKGAHPLIWQAVIALKNKGVEKLIMNIEEIDNNRDEKSISIASFKRGFGLKEKEVKKIYFL